MATTYYAKVYEGIVTNVIVASQDFINSYSDGRPGNWLLTDINTIHNVHYGPDGQPDGLPPFRGNYAVIGGHYDATNDVFYAPKPYKNAVLSSTSWSWVSPVPTLPTIVSCTPVVNGVEVSFLYPEVLPASGIVKWVYYADEGVGIVQQDLNLTTPPLVIPNLQGGMTYTINIGCVDGDGNTYWTVNPEEVVPLVALPPSVTGATPANASATITWATSPNQEDGVPPPLGAVLWKIGYKPESSSGDYTWVDSTDAEPTYTLTGLTNGTKYAVVVADIVNGIESNPSQPFYVTPAA